MCKCGDSHLCLPRMSDRTRELQLSATTCTCLVLYWSLSCYQSSSDLSWHEQGTSKHARLVPRTATVTADPLGLLGWVEGHFTSSSIASNKWSIGLGSREFGGQVKSLVFVWSCHVPHIIPEWYRAWGSLTWTAIMQECLGGWDMYVTSTWILGKFPIGPLQ